ncbi:type 1 glutamine amidotransferase [Inquilinus sp. CAU 1745]|uniref:type 1 glutamine amidotransferase n=1 Tax=Inquilinus sp. CAU 1745 TaxID=3140369 RepID=UPI00325AE5CB
MSAPKILILQNSPGAPAGVVGDQLARAGASLDTRLALGGDPLPSAPEGYDGLLVLGGPMSPNDDDDYPGLKAERELIRAFAASGRPVLGICLGAQLIARAFGGTARRHDIPEIGFTQIELTKDAAGDHLMGGFDTLPRLMHWHYDTFDLPDGAVLLATNSVCRNQAFRLGQEVHAVQFHPEVTAEIIRDWLRRFRAEGVSPDAISEDEMEAQMRDHLAAAESFGRTLADRWLALVERSRAGSAVLSV